MEDIINMLDIAIVHIHRKSYLKAKHSLVKASFYSRRYEYESTGQRWRYFRSLTNELEKRIARLDVKYRYS